MTVQNLDAACAELGAKLGASGTNAKETENSITKALGVLEEQGVYAMFLYLFAREGAKFAEGLLGFLEAWCELKDGKQLHDSWVKAKSSRERNNAAKNPSDDARRAIFGALARLSGGENGLDKLLFARDLLHRALVYARYHAKARSAGRGEGGS